jgi:hypothetical protein
MNWLCGPVQSTSSNLRQASNAQLIKRRAMQRLIHLIHQ